MSPHLLYSQGVPPYFLCINRDSYFYTKFKQIAFQLKRARKTHRAQVEKKIISLFIHQAWKFWTFVTNTLLLLSIEFRLATISNAAASPASLPFWPLQASAALKVSTLNFLRLLKKEIPSPSDIFAAQDNPDLGDREATQPGLHPRNGLLCHGETNQIFLPQEGTVLLFSSSKYWGLSMPLFLNHVISFLSMYSL